LIAPFTYEAAGWHPVAGIWSGATAATGSAAGTNHTGDPLTQLIRTDHPDHATAVLGLSGTRALDALFDWRNQDG
jgi:hypothetical protein